MKTPEDNRILIYSHDGEIARITQEAHNRVGILNTILQHGVTFDELQGMQNVNVSIHTKLLEENLEYQRLYNGGIRGIEVERSAKLIALERNLKSWFNHRGDRFQFLTFTTSWHVDHSVLEEYFEQKQFKVYVPESRVEEYRQLQALCAYFAEKRMPNNQVSASSFLNSRIESIGQFSFRPRWQYFQ